MSPYDNLWQTILMDLERLYNEDIYAELFQPITSTHKYQNGLITIVVASEYIKNRINKLYIGKINELASKYSDNPVRFKFVSQEEITPAEEPVHERKISLDYRQNNLNSTYTFDSFVEFVVDSSFEFVVDWFEPFVVVDLIVVDSFEPFVVVDLIVVFDFHLPT